MKKMSPKFFLLTEEHLWVYLAEKLAKVLAHFSHFPADIQFFLLKNNKYFLK